METLTKIFWGFILFLVLYVIWVWPYINRFKLRIVAGPKGSGKSTYLTMKGYKYLKKGWDVYTNMEDCFLPGVKIVNPNDFGPYMVSKNSVCLFDEAMTIWDCRDFKAFSPEQRNAFVYSRHHKVILYVATQDYNGIDKKIRVLADEIVLLQNLGVVFTLIRPIRKKLTLSKKKTDEATGNTEEGFVEHMSFKSIFSWRMLYIPKYAKYFDSYVTEDLPPIPYIQR